MRFANTACFGLLTAALALAGCVPNATVYYLPSVEGGERSAGTCVPTESRIRFAVGGVRFLAIANISSNTIHPSIFIDPLPGQTVRFESEVFEVRVTGGESPLAGVSISVSRPDGVGSATVPYPAEGRLPRRPAFTNLSVHLRVPRTDIEAFDLSSPPLVVNGAAFDVPDVHFQKKLWVGISPFNC